MAICFARLKRMPVILLSQIIPSADDLLALEPDELGLALLQCFKSYSQNELETYYGHRNNFLNSGDPVRGYPDAYHSRILSAVNAAYSWLEREMLITKRAGAERDWFEITPKGQKIDAANVHAYRHANILPKHLLHSSIAKKVEAQFLRGEYDTAISTAFKQVEIAVRAAGKFPASVIGSTLMRAAFDPQGGPLADMSQEKSEREALAHLFAGAIGFCKNPTSHRDVDVPAVDAAQLLVMASHLLRIVDARTHPTP
jgi:uncharacterized protein (TIGR02391 family)